ncbi:MAG TPA: hypothetical protein VH082_01090 [Rudaea sp.]|jgi:hypothetical protein|nr:hypothetical protein [Rudaea sp.]
MKRLIAVASMIAVFVLANGPAFADEVIKNRVSADTLDKFQAVADEVRGEMSTGGRYEFITSQDKIKADSDLNAMAAMLQKSGSVGAMTQPEKVKLFNTQEHLNGILTHSDRNRLVCEHSAPVGTSIPRTTCQTVAEIEQNRKDGKEEIKQAGEVGSVCRRFCRSN